VLSEDPAEHVGDLAQGRVRLHTFEDHGVLGPASDPFQAPQGSLHGATVAIAPDRCQAFKLPSGLLGVDGLKLLDRWGGRLEAVDPHDDPLLGFDGALVSVGALVDLGDLESTVEGAQSAAHLVDTPDVIRGLAFQAVGQIFYVVGARQRVHRVGNARLVGEHLLGPEG